MNAVDFGITVIILISLLIGWRRGFLREVLSLLSWAAALIAAVQFAEALGARFAGVIDQPLLQMVAAFTLIFVLVLFAFSYLSHRLCLWLAVSGVTGVDRTLGILFGLARGALIVTALLLLAWFMNFGDASLAESKFIPFFMPLAEALLYFLPPGLAGHL